jgi:hypothetical protein
MSLKDKVAVVTGAASGIGEHCARTFANHGAAVVIADLNLATAGKMADGIVSADGKALAVAMDVTNEEAVNAGIDEAAKVFGGIDVLASNRRGVVDNSAKGVNRGKSLVTFALGDRPMYDFLNDYPAIESYPVDYVNDPHTIARNPLMISVNSTVEMDLAGACNSEHINGHQYSASGDPLDFVHGAYASSGGKSIIAFIQLRATGGSRRSYPACRALSQRRELTSISLLRNSALQT